MVVSVIAPSGYPLRFFAESTKDENLETMLNQINGIYQIASANDLVAFADIVDGTNGAEQHTLANAVLTADIGLTGVVWIPIGLYTDGIDVKSTGNYEGTFDGNGHVIQNLTVPRYDSYEVGLFGRTDQTTIRKLGIVNATVTSNKGVRCGVLGGEIYQSNVENCFTAGTITISTSNSQKGGIAGEGASSTRTEELKALIRLLVYYQQTAKNHADAESKK